MAPSIKHQKIIFDFCNSFKSKPHKNSIHTQKINFSLSVCLLNYTPFLSAGKIKINFNSITQPLPDNQKTNNPEKSVSIILY